MTISIQKTDLKEFTLPQLVEWLALHDIESYRALQIFRWIYLRQTDSFDAMTDIPKRVRIQLSEHFVVARLWKILVEKSFDGTKKYLFELKDGNHIESVLIPEKDHDTLCISSQVGCAQGCRFCRTAASGFVRNLSQGEIIAQVRDVLQDLKQPERLSNIVFMGMGEPLANYVNLRGAIEIITDNDKGLRFAHRRITVSTAGLLPRLSDLGRDTRVNLAISLNATDNDTRSRLMPINRSHPIEKLIAACRAYPLPPGRRITVEYVLLKGINDSLDDAERLAQMLRPLKAKINLIPFNAFNGCGFSGTREAEIRQFQNVLIERHYTAIIRQSKGSDISAACGQLAGKYEPSSA